MTKTVETTKTDVVVIDLKKEVVAVIAADVAYNVVMDKATAKLNEKAVLLLIKAGYDVALGTVHNEAVLKVCKTAVKTQLETIHGTFITRDTEGTAGIAAKAYKSISSALQMSSAVGRNGETGKGQANASAGKVTGTRTEKTDTTEQPKQGETVLRKQGEKPAVTMPELQEITQAGKLHVLRGDALSDQQVRYDMAGTPAEIWEANRDLFLDFIATNAQAQADIAYRLSIG